MAFSYLPLLVVCEPILGRKRQRSERAGSLTPFRPSGPPHRAVSDCGGVRMRGWEFDKGLQMVLVDTGVENHGAGHTVGRSPTVPGTQH